MKPPLPVQGAWLGRRVEVIFGRDTARVFLGTIIRDDAARPGVLIIALDDGGAVLASECQYRPLGEVAK